MTGVLKRWHATAIFGAFLAAWMAQQLSAVTIVLPASHDATIFQNNPDNGSGAGNGLFAGTNGSVSPRRALLAFDVTTLPAGATIQSATLTLYLGQFAGSGGAGGGPPTSTIELHRITNDWDEGLTSQHIPPTDSLGQGGQGSPAAIGDVTWNERSYGASPSHPWLQPGGDFVSTISSSAIVDTTVDAPFNWPSTPNMVMDIQNWLTDPSTNFGWMLVNEDETSSRTFRAFYSREVATEEHRPALTVAYSLPASPSADFNADHFVDGADLELWRSGFGSGPGALSTQGDANADGRVNGADFFIWQKQLSQSAVLGATSVVPEPISRALIMLLGIGASKRRRHAGNSFGFLSTPSTEGGAGSVCRHLAAHRRVKKSLPREIGPIRPQRIASAACSR